MNLGNKIGIIGGGPGGLSAGMILSSKGFDVTIFEKTNKIGGRTKSFQLGDTIHDIGPTFLMMKFVIDKLFNDCNLKPENFMEMFPLNPMYRLQFNNDKYIDMFDDSDLQKKELERVFPNEVKGFSKWLKKSQKRYKIFMPLLEKKYSSLLSYIDFNVLKSLPYLNLHQSLYKSLDKYFNDDQIKMGFCFQSKYIGMSPWTCPSIFNIIPFVEHQFGVWHIKGGISELTSSMGRAFTSLGGKINYNCEVLNLPIDNKKNINGILYKKDGKDVMFDDSFDKYIINSDFSNSVMNIFEPETTEKLFGRYSASSLPKKQHSCSTFMIYLELDKLYNEFPFHTIQFADDYKKNVDDIVNGRISFDDFSIYVRNASIADKTLAKNGKSGVYILVPISNLIELEKHLNNGKLPKPEILSENQFNKNGIKVSKLNISKSEKYWNDNKNIEKLKNKCYEIIEKRFSIQNFKSHILNEKVITPLDWNNDLDVWNGSVFSLGHNVSQMLLFRPNNKFQYLKNAFLANGGTHPGSGIPTILESGRITSKIICDEYNVKYDKGSYISDLKF